MVRIFFSYSHDSDEHKLWVLEKANDLTSRGFEAVLDQTHLEPGQDILVFAEAAVKSADFILLVCTPEYGQRANGRKKGVGWEAQMITAEMYAGSSKKVIALLREGNHLISVPQFMQTKLFVDLRNDGGGANWESLCNHLQKKGEVLDIGTLVFEAMFAYDETKIYNQPTLRELKRFTEFVETGQNEAGRWFVVRRDPIKDDQATIFFQNPVSET